MKILATKDQIEEFKRNKDKANEGCNVCPYCGETRKSFGINDFINEDFGIFKHGKVYYQGFFNVKVMNKD